LNKLWPSAEAALDGLLHDGITMAVGGFGVVGAPEILIEAVKKASVRNLIIASNNCGIDGVGLATLLTDHQIGRMICSYVGGNAELERQYLAGEIEVEFCPQGTLAERMRAGGAGIPGFYTRTGVGTIIADGKDHKEFDGVPYLLERGIRADVALVKAWKADTHGNLVYRQAARNFNPGAAMSGKVTVAEVEILVEAGELDPNQIHTPGIFVQRLVHNPAPIRRFDILTTREN